MDCKDIREKFSAYIDDVLSTQEKMVIDEHLKSCPECAEALADLKKTVEHVKGLETVEPPVWMKQKIMTRIRAEAQPKKSLFRKLFYPLHIKLPIEAVATVLVVGLALYIYRDIAPEMKLAKAPSEEAVPQVLSKDLPPPSPPLAKGGEGGFEEKRAVPAKPAEQPAPSREPESARDRFKMAPKGPEPLQQADKLASSKAQELEKKEEAKAPAAAKRHEQAPAAGAIAKDEARQEARAAAPRAKLSLMEKKDEKTLTLSVLVKDPETAIQEIEKILREREGKAIHRESVEGKEIITAEVDVGRLKELMGKLRSVGRVKEREVDIKASGTKVAIRIEVARISEQR